MIRADAGRLIAIIVTAYPNSDKYKDKESVNNAVSLWADFFADDDERIVALAVKKHIATSKWPPAIAEIREIMTEITHPDLIPPDEAWEAVNKLMHTHPERLYNPTTAYLPRAIAEAVDAVGYGTLWTLHCAAARGRDNKAGLDRVAFIQAYEPKYQRARELAQLPPGIRQNIQAVQGAIGTGDRAMLENVAERYEAKQRQYDDLWRKPNRLALTDGEDDQIARLEERQLQYLEERVSSGGGDDEI
jgi:hypothetical protein